MSAATGMATGWQALAKCVGKSALFYPAKGESTAPAKAICAECPVKPSCLRFSLENKETFGIWGGTSEKERRVLRRQLHLPRKSTGGERCPNDHLFTKENTRITKLGFRRCKQCQRDRNREARLKKSAAKQMRSANAEAWSRAVEASSTPAPNDERTINEYTRHSSEHDDTQRHNSHQGTPTSNCPNGQLLRSNCVGLRNGSRIRIGRGTSRCVDTVTDYNRGPRSEPGKITAPETGQPIAEPIALASPAVNGPTPVTECEKAAAEVFPKELWAEAFAVIKFEGGTPGGVAQNKDAVRSKDHGCFQINDYWQLRGKQAHNTNPPSRWWDYNAIFDPNYNARVAFNIYKANSNTWRPWYSVCTRGAERVPKARCGR